MQWKSFVFILAAASPALARSHGQHKHRHGVRHEHEVEKRAVGGIEVAKEIAGFFDAEPVVVTETAWECCTTSTLSSVTPTEPATFIELPPVETETSTSTSTSTSTPIPEPEPETTTSTSTPVETPTPTPEPEPETTTTTETSTSTEAPSSTVAAPVSDWTKIPDSFSFSAFGGRTEQSITGNKFTYQGNVGKPWGSNIIEVSAEEASNYKYVVQFNGSPEKKWHVRIWNKIGPDFKMTGWYNNNAAVFFSLEANEVRYVAFDENTQASWGAAPGDSLPVDEFGGYSCTWGEVDFGSTVNEGWSGWDVSAIQAEAAKQHIQGMKMCSWDGSNCSIITTGAALVKDAYMEKDKWADGIGGKVVPGAVRVVTHLDYSG
ncbi:hypothetical protein BJY04DRAFT_200079 [Aspergillus karnatakaensis]|uniref:uncharacterized protein n=1 Tax=Aspergillus karnatakaensis TaxID=1810916 RepID=UPI003CCD0D5F